MFPTHRMIPLATLLVVIPCTGRGLAEGKPNTSPPVVEAEAHEVIQDYRTNAALADEKYTEKRVAVKGHMARITGVAVVEANGHQGAVYLLEMTPFLEQTPGGPKAMTYLSFRFTDADRSRLAKLKKDQAVTVEGLCKGFAPQEENGRRAIYFWDCQIAAADK